MKESKNLFHEFPPVTTEEWEEQIKIDLKDPGKNKMLTWETIEGIRIKPYYRQEDLQKLDYLYTYPGEFPFLRGNKINNNKWQIRQDIKVDNINSANQTALYTIKKGSDSIGFITGNKVEHIEDTIFKSQKDFSTLLKNISLDSVCLNFISSNASPYYMTLLDNEAGIQKTDRKKMKGSFDYDPLGYLSLTGNFYKTEDFSFNKGSEILAYAKEKLPNFKVLGINGQIINNSGASVVQELGFSLAMANEYISRFMSNGIKLSDIVSRLQFNFSIGSNYFMEIAKLRAARFLWSKIIEAYDPECKINPLMFIHSTTSNWNKTIFDHHVNILRTTTEAMASIIGGTDSLTINPFDSINKNTSLRSERIARNIQILLKEEAYFDRVIDPGSGSYYIENLTDAVVEASWEIFLQTEDKGGYSKALIQGFVQKEIEKTAIKRKENIQYGNEILLGTNQYPNPEENTITEIAISSEKQKKPSNKKVIARPLKIFRAAEEFERLRLKTIKSDKPQPVVYLLNFGNPSKSKARAFFSFNFFTCAGFKVLDSPVLNSVKKGIQESLKSKADIIVFCSSDEEYNKHIPEIYDQIKDKAIIVIAGYPKDFIDSLRSLGIHYFIHSGSNLLSSLEKFQVELGI